MTTVKVIISQTPFRISFFGGGTDFPDYYRFHGGSVILTTINKYSYISLHKQGPFFKYKIKANYSVTETADNPESIKHPLIRETLKFLAYDCRIEIGHISDLPGRTGIGSSSSFTVGLLNALHAMRGEKPAPEQLAREAVEIERNRVKDAGGHQDQYAAAYGGFIRLDFRNDGRVIVRHIKLPAGRLADLRKRLMIFYSGLEKSSDTIQRRQNANIPHNLSALCDMQNMVDKAETILRESNADIDEFGRLLNESWQKKRSLAAGISTPLIDHAYKASLKAGALGGKLLGAGGRGFLLLYADPTHHRKIRNALRCMPEVDFSLSKNGSRIIFRQNERS